MLFLVSFSMFLFLFMILEYFWVFSLFFLGMMFMFSLKFVYFPVSEYSYVSSMLSIDFFSSYLISLSIWVSILMILSSFKIKFVQNYSFSFINVVLILLLILIMSFSVMNFFSFYIFFEASLIPTLILVLTWGYQPERTQAGFYLMMYTIVASLPLLLNLINLNMKNKTLLMMIFVNSGMVGCYSDLVLWIFIMMAFMVKLPMFMTHLWLPKAHVEAPVAGSMILAAILLKLGGYGLLRVSFFVSNMNSWIFPIFSSISMWGCVLTSLICVRQTDMKSLIAYSSVSHMALLICGLLNQSIFGIMGTVMMMIAHGLSSSLLFMIANMTYEKTQTRNLMLSKGLLIFSPIFSLFWFLSCMSNMGGPPSINLVSEIFLINSIVYSSLIYVFVLIPVLFLSACYSLVLYSSINHGNSIHYVNPKNMYLFRNMLSIIMHVVPIFSMVFIISSMVSV